MAGPTFKEVYGFPIEDWSTHVCRETEEVANLKKLLKQQQIEDFVRKNGVTKIDPPVKKGNEEVNINPFNIGTREGSLKDARNISDFVGAGDDIGAPNRRPFSGRNSQGRDDYQGALRALAYVSDKDLTTRENENGLIPRKVRDNLRAQINRHLKRGGRIDDDTQKLKLPPGYVLGHYEKELYTGELAEATPAREGFDCNNARVITRRQNQIEEAKRLKRLQEDALALKAIANEVLKKSALGGPPSDNINRKGAKSSTPLGGVPPPSRKNLISSTSIRLVDPAPTKSGETDEKSKKNADVRIRTIEGLFKNAIKVLRILEGLHGAAMTIIGAVGMGVEGFHKVTKVILTGDDLRSNEYEMVNELEKDIKNSLGDYNNCHETLISFEREISVAQLSGDLSDPWIKDFYAYSIEELIIELKRRLNEIEDVKRLIANALIFIPKRVALHNLAIKDKSVLLTLMLGMGLEGTSDLEMLEMELQQKDSPDIIRALNSALTMLEMRSIGVGIDIQTQEDWLKLLKI